MLGKLIKYDLKFVYKQLIVFYIIILLLAITARLTANIEGNFLLKFLHEFSQGAAFGFSFGMIINASMRTWAKYKYSLYGDESYLTHTLPLSHRTIWTAKFLSSLLVIIISLALFVCAMVIMFLTPYAIDVFATRGDIVWPHVFAFAFAAIGQFCFVMQCGLMGITIGHFFNSHRTLLSVIFGVAIYFICEMAMLGLCFLWSNFVPSIHNMLLYDTMPDPFDTAKLMTCVGVIYAAFVAGMYFVNYKLLQRGVNVD